jgi:hypothetical protein
MFFRNGRVYRKNGPSSFGICPEDDHCREISNAEFVENILGYSLSEEDRQMHPTDSAILCCVKIWGGEETKFAGTVTTAYKGIAYMRKSLK